MAPSGKTHTQGPGATGPDDTVQDHVSDLVIVRHGETPRNVARTVGRFIANSQSLHEAGILPDHLVELTDVGKRQATLLGKALTRLLPDLNEFDVFFDSGYERSMATLNAILKAFGMTRDADGRRRSHIDLRERDPGYTFNMTITEINALFPWYREYEEIVGDFYAKSPGGESVADVCTRVHMFLNSLRRARKGQRVLIVTHGRVILALRYWLEGWFPEEAEQLFRKGSVASCEVLRYLRQPIGARCEFVPDSTFEDAVWADYKARCLRGKIKLKDRIEGKRARTPRRYSYYPEPSLRARSRAKKRRPSSADGR